jgi:hypothetical protein
MKWKQTIIMFHLFIIEYILYKNIYLIEIKCNLFRVIFIKEYNKLLLIN